MTPFVKRVGVFCLNLGAKICKNLCLNMQVGEGEGRRQSGVATTRFLHSRLLRSICENRRKSVVKYASYSGREMPTERRNYKERFYFVIALPISEKRQTQGSER